MTVDAAANWGIVARTELEFKTAVTLCYFIKKKKNDIKHLEQLKSGFKRTIK